jgi:hypothetical protein
MPGSTSLLIQAWVGETEEPAVRAAAALLATHLNAAAGAPHTVRCAFPTGIDTLDRSGETTIIVTSLLRDVDTDEPWPETERRVRARYLALAEEGTFVVLICTVLRHLPAELPPAQTTARRVRIRRLNLLAAEISRETGFLVVDIDRSLADIGAQPLQTDYRLTGPFGAEAAGKVIAMTVLAAGLDAVASIDHQDAARDRIAAYQPARATEAAPPVEMVGVHRVPSRSRSGRTQIVMPVVHGVDENQVDLQLRRLMQGQIGGRAAAAMLMRSVGQHGWRSTAMRLAAGIARYVRNRALMSR